MKILVVGATTVTAKHLIKYILESGRHQARLMLNNSVQVAYYEEKGIETVLFDQNHKPKFKDLALATKDIDAIVLIGSFHEGEKEPFLRIDEMIRFIEMIKYLGIKRFVHMSPSQSGRFISNRMPDIFRYSFIENYYIDRWLKTSDLDFTIIHTGTLIDIHGTGLIQIIENKINNNQISREDVAKVILSCLENDRTIGKELSIASGKIPIEDALTFHKK